MKHSADLDPSAARLSKLGAGQLTRCLALLLQVPPVAETWAVAPLATSCDTECALYGLVCDEATMRTVTTDPLFLARVNNTVVAYLSCDTYDRTAAVHNPSFSMSKAARVCSTNGGGSTCAASAAAAQRLW